MLDLPISDKLNKQLSFIIEIDQLKTVLRQAKIMDGSRQENSAEHSWHFAMTMILLAEYSSAKVDINKTIKMALIHDVVEVYAGDTFVYDEVARQAKIEVEKKAAEKIFSLLPEEQGQELYQLWWEYESQETAESRFAMAVDRLLPILCNYHTGGYSWKKHGIRREQVDAKNELWKTAAPELHEFVCILLKQAEENGLLAES